MSLELHPLTEREFFRFFRMTVQPPIFGYVLRDGIKTVAIGGVVFDEHGIAWAFLDFLPGRNTGALYKHACRLFRDVQEMGIEEVFITRDHEYATSQRLIERLGFHKTDRTLDGKEVWKWVRQQGS